VGDFEAGTLVSAESSLKYHPYCIGILTCSCRSRARTLSGGQFDWGGRLLKCNGGALRFPQHGRKSCVECKRIRELNCETYKSSRYESRG
jgi:hypothetical protein